MDLFENQRQAALERVKPLAARMRPRTLDEFCGQRHLLGPGRLLRRMINAEAAASLIFHGPPGCGKTTLARLIAQHSEAAFVQLNATEAGVKDVRAVAEEARARLLGNDQRTLLFLDEAHRFNRAQQDVLLGDVEEGRLTLIGATTENPHYALNAPLLSRSHVFRFEPLGAGELLGLLRRAVEDGERGLGKFAAEVDDAAYDLFLAWSGGDARRALTALETAVLSQPRGDDGRLHIGRAEAEASMQKPALRHDRTGDMHYDVVSAFIKSMRGSDPDATLYWLARMLQAGEDPRFIARRICIAASEEVGLADSQALCVAAAAAQAVELVGLPEAQLNLAQAALYVATAPKSGRVTAAIGAALRDVEHNWPLPVPAALRGTGSKRGAPDGMAAYRSPHETAEGFVRQDYLGAAVRYYNPTDRGAEALIAERLAQWWPERQQARNNKESPSV